MTTAIREIQEQDLYATLSASEQTVVLVYQSYSDLCHATKPHLEALAAEHGFTLVTLNADKQIPWWEAGSLVPSVSVFRRSSRVQTPMAGAKTRKAIINYLAECGVISQ